MSLAIEEFRNVPRELLLGICLSLQENIGDLEPINTYTSEQLYEWLISTHYWEPREDKFFPLTNASLPVTIV